jgi:2-methylisocitrate lyase-like PEP mutase family enzyme
MPISAPLSAAALVPRKEFVDKIRLACRQRDQSDKDFVIIARSDSCRFEGLDVARRA